MLVPFADRVDLLSTAATHLQRRVLDYITGNLSVTAGGLYSHRMPTAALDVLGPDRVMFGVDSPYAAPPLRATPVPPAWEASTPATHSPAPAAPAPS